MRTKRRFIPLFLFVLAACAGDGISATDDGGTDDAGDSDAGYGPSSDATIQDAAQPLEAMIEEPEPPPSDDAAVVDATPPDPCGALGQPCDTNGGLGACPFFFTCVSAANVADADFNPFPDAGSDADAGSDSATDAGSDAPSDAASDAAPDADAGPPPDGVCVPIFPPLTSCDPSNHCGDAGIACLIAGQTCLNAQQYECICGKPGKTRACGPP